MPGFVVVSVRLDLGDGLAEQAKAGLGLVGPQDQRRRHADDVLACLENEQTSRSNGLDAGSFKVCSMAQPLTSCLSGRCLTGLIGNEPDSRFRGLQGAPPAIVDGRLGTSEFQRPGGKPVRDVGCRPAMSSKSFGDNMCQLYESARPTGWAWCNSHRNSKARQLRLRRCAPSPSSVAPTRRPRVGRWYPPS